jgi:PadR family transcriptional regulator, regulatory protein AphA
MAKRDIRLTPTSYVVLGLISAAGRPATPYELKQMHAGGIGGFWTLNHAQTPAGRRALEEWLATPSDEFTELRDLGLLQLFFGADPRAVAEVQLRIHGEALVSYEALRASADDWPEGPRLVLESGIGHEREWLRFWRRVAERTD